MSLSSVRRFPQTVYIPPLQLCGEVYRAFPQDGILRYLFEHWRPRFDTEPLPLTRRQITLDVVEAEEKTGKEEAELLPKKVQQSASSLSDSESKETASSLKFNPAPHYKILENLFPFPPSSFCKEKYLLLCYLKMVMKLQE